jgi:hypothetical protein
MASSILNSDDGVISGTSGLKSTGGDDGNLVFQSKGTETARINTDKQIVAAAGTASLPIYSTTGDLNTGIFFPAADTIAFAEGGAEAMRIDSSGNVLVGITTARANAGDVQVSKGISFPATQSAQSDANTLDDYEEGTWTAAVSGVTTVANDWSIYTKIGRIVIVTAHLNISSGTAPPDTFSITGLPFTSASDSRSAVTIVVQDQSDGFAQVTGPTAVISSEVGSIGVDLHGFAIAIADRINITCIYSV